MQDEDRARFLHVYDLLTNIASGIAQGSKTLVEASKTELGTLAVKEGEVTVTFEMSSVAVKNGVEGPGLGARTVQPFPQLPPLATVLCWGDNILLDSVCQYVFKNFPGVTTVKIESPTPIMAISKIK